MRDQQAAGDSANRQGVGPTLRREICLPLGPPWCLGGWVTGMETRSPTFPSCCLSGRLGCAREPGEGRYLSDISLWRRAGNFMRKIHRGSETVAGLASQPGSFQPGWGRSKARAPFKVFPRTRLYLGSRTFNSQLPTTARERVIPVAPSTPNCQNIFRINLFKMLKC